MDHEILIPLIIFGSIAYVIKVLSENSVRRLLIKEKMINEDLKYLYAGRCDVQAPASLKWGMVLLALGAAALVYKIIGSLIAVDEVLLIAMMLIFGGGSLIAFYVMMSRKGNKEPHS